MLYKEVKKEKIYYVIWHSCFICFYVLCFWFCYKWSWVDNFMLIFMLKVSWVISSRYRGIPLYQLLGTTFLKFLNFEYHARALENLIKLSLHFNFFFTARKCFSCKHNWFLLQLLKHAENWTLRVVLICIFLFNH